MPGDSPHFPTNIPDLTDMREVVDDVDDVIATDHNDVIKEIIAMAAELGELPKGDYADVKTRLDALEHKSQCKVYRGGTDQSIYDHSTTRVAFNASEYDALSEFDITTLNKFTATTAGIYLLTGSLRIKLLTADTNVFIYAYINGANSQAYAVAPCKSAWVSFPFSFTLKLAATDYVQIYVYHEDSTARNLDLGASDTWLSITKLQN